MKQILKTFLIVLLSILTLTISACKNDGIKDDDKPSSSIIINPDDNQSDDQIIKEDASSLGKSINVVTASRYNDFKNGVSVLKNNNNLIYKKNRDAKSSSTSATSENSISEIIKNFNNSFSLGVGVELGSKDTFYCDINTGFSTNNSIKHNEYCSQYFYTCTTTTKKELYYIDNYKVEGLFENNYSSDYLSSLEQLSQNGDYESFFDKYGTHLVGAAIYGGKAELYYSLVTEKTSLSNENKLKVESKVEAGIKGLSGKVEIINELKSELNLNNEKIASNLYAKAVGGDTFTCTDFKDYATELQKWGKSMDSDSANSVLISYANDGLLPLWSILPKKYSDLAESMESAFVYYYKKGLSKIIENFTPAMINLEDTIHFAGGEGSISNPYKISTIDHLVNIDYDVNAHYILVNDIEIPVNHQWAPIGGPYGEKIFNGILDGNGFSILNFHRTNAIAEKNSRSYFGLFGRIGKEGIVKNIKFVDVNVNITGPKKNNAGMRAFYGVVCGRLDGTLQNIETSGSFIINNYTNGESYIGGMTGSAFNAEIVECVNKMYVYGSRYALQVGGIVGYSNGGKVKNCTNKGNITSSESIIGGFTYAGGIIGGINLYNETTLLHCVNSGTISAKRPGLANGDAQQGDLFGKKVTASFDKDE